jgi:hypothetical protein
VVIVDLSILTANKINIMKKKLGPIAVVLYCFHVPCVRQFSPRGAGSQYSHPLLKVRKRRTGRATTGIRKK